MCRIQSVSNTAKPVPTGMPAASHSIAESSYQNILRVHYDAHDDDADAAACDDADDSNNDHKDNDADDVDDTELHHEILNTSWHFFFGVGFGGSTISSQKVLAWLVGWSIAFTCHGHLQHDSLLGLTGDEILTAILYRLYTCIHSVCIIDS